MISNIGLVIFLLVIIVSLHHVTCDEDLFRWVWFLFCRKFYEFIHLKFSRIEIQRVPSKFSTQANCTITENNDTICDVMSRHFGRVSVIRSSAQENLINYFDVSDDQYRFGKFLSFFVIVLFYGKYLHWYTVSIFFCGVRYRFVRSMGTIKSM